MTPWELAKESFEIVKQCEQKAGRCMRLYSMTKSTYFLEQAQDWGLHAVVIDSLYDDIYSGSYTGAVTT